MKTIGHLGVFPVYRDNPYVNLLLLAPRARGWDVVEMARLERLEEQLARFAAGDVFHMHWTSPIVQRADTADEARERLDRFVAAVDGARSHGVSVVWTVHNVLPHDARHIELEIELCQYLADAADVVHALTPDTVAMTSEYYVIDPAKVVVIPHPSYQGVYPSSMSRPDARAALGVTDDERAILFFGQMRPYKGLDVLLAAVGQLPPSVRPVLLLAGRASAEEAAALDSMLPGGVRTIRSTEFIDDADIERWFRAADVAVFPYRRVLNSGSLHLAATFGTPTVLPDEPHLRREFGDEAWVSFYDPTDAVGSLTALLASDDALGSDLTREAAASFSARMAPFALSRRFARVLDGLEAPVPSGS